MKPRQSKPSPRPKPPVVMDVPLALDLVYYKTIHADLATMSNDELVSHYKDYGVAEGRPGAPEAFRENFLGLISPSLDTLEIGPFCAPALRGDKVRYFDIADRDALLEMAKLHGLSPDNTPHIHYVSSTADAAVITDQFDQVFSSHCIEHQPDLVRHLADVARILRPAGRYFIIIPDKRYCFDHFLAETTIADVLGAHLERRRTHLTKSVLEHLLLKTHNEPARHWRGDHGSMAELGESDLKTIKASIEHVKKNVGQYLDTHAWHFTPMGFQRIVDRLYELGLSRLKVERIYNTPVPQFEFCALLTKLS
jgi:SAM-dependent methyltransferase